MKKNKYTISVPVQCEAILGIVEEFNVMEAIEESHNLDVPNLCFHCAGKFILGEPEWDKVDAERVDD